jgi:AbrB family looped-hinge helix DNA binding protein
LTSDEVTPSGETVEADTGVLPPRSTTGWRRIRENCVGETSHLSPVFLVPGFPTIEIACLRFPYPGLQKRETGGTLSTFGEGLRPVRWMYAYKKIVTLRTSDIIIIFVMSEISVKAKVNENGRIVIPAEMRKAMGIQPGDDLVMTLEDGVLRIETQRERIRRVQQSLGRLIPAERALSTELTDERREEVRKEMEDWIG